jgi:hypothetical protein
MRVSLSRRGPADAEMGRFACGRHRPSPPGRTRRNRAFGPYARAAAAIKGFSRRHPSRVNTTWGFAYDTDHAARDRRDEDCDPRLSRSCPAAPLRVATADARRT